ncbi:MAG: transposase [Thermodesulfobacteriota bacterium]|nr:transposase [Thermodesulfobacteriota bacterium]
MKGTLKPPTIPEDEKSPIVQELLAFIEQQSSIIQQLIEEIQKLKDEIARLKNQPPKPKIKPSSLGKKKKGKSKKSKGKRPGSKKRHKTAKLKIHETKPIEPEHIPDRSEFRYYKTFVVQDLKIESHNIRYRLKVYETPDGNYVTGKLPEYLNGGHYGPTLIRFILYQYYHCHVTQPLLLEQLHELDIDISKGQLNNILIENKDCYHKEKDSILAVGLQVSSYINVDDTGARHKGKNGYCTHIGNESFSWFESTESKSRINFLKLMRAGHSDYLINTDAITYMEANKLPKYILKPIIANLGMIFANDSQWNDFVADNGIVKNRHLQIATEGALIGSIIEHGISKELVIISDDAGQFNVLLHALCWIHANRAIDKIIPFTDQAKKDLDTVKDHVWLLYEGLKKYKENPKLKDKKRLEDMFDEIFTTKTSSVTLNAALQRIYNNKSELLLVLERPDIPLHNNGAENAIREYVKKRKISGSTRSEPGRQCRDTFTSLKKTCRKLGVSFWQYLKDRIENTGLIPDLSDLIRQQVLNPG